MLGPQPRQRLAARAGIAERLRQRLALTPLDLPPDAIAVTASIGVAEYRPGDTLVFGCETKGLPDDLLAAHAGSVLGIPILTDHVRSLNLSSAVAVVVYEALRQLDAHP